MAAPLETDSRSMKKILVPLNLFEESYSSVAVGAYFAETCGANLVLLHVVRIGFAEPACLIPELLARADSQLKAIANVFGSRVKVETIVRTGSPAQVIAQEASRMVADAMVMTTHGCRGWRTWLHRNTAFQVLETVRCPIWLLAPADSNQSFTLTLANWSRGRSGGLGPHALALGAEAHFSKAEPVADGAPQIVFQFGA